MAEPPKPAQELNGWKQISRYLRVSVRTAQNFEKEQGLPVCRGAGIKVPVYAIAAELDAWKATLNVARSEDSVNPAPAIQVEEVDRRHWLRYALGGGLLVLALGAAVIYWVAVPHGPPADFRVEGKNLVVLNAKGKELWHHPFPRNLVPAVYTGEFRNRLTWLGDLDGDGRLELMFTAVPENWNEAGHTLLCFGAAGNIKWQFSPGRPVIDTTGDRMVPPYYIEDIQVLAGKTPAETRIAVSSIHYLSQPGQVALLDTHGRVQGEYWHPGHLNFMAQSDLDGDGRNELLLAGVNNGDHQATLVVLDPWSISGLMTPVEMKDQRFRLVDMPPAKEKAVVLFPRSCISKGKPYTRVKALLVLRDRLLVVTAEGVAMDDPGFTYELDYSLRPVNVVPSGDGVRVAHQALEARGELDHPYSTNDWERLKSGVIIHRGK